MCWKWTKGRTFWRTQHYRSAFMWKFEETFKWREESDDTLLSWTAGVCCSIVIHWPAVGVRVNSKDPFSVLYLSMTLFQLNPLCWEQKPISLNMVLFMLLFWLLFVCFTCFVLFPHHFFGIDFVSKDQMGHRLGCGHIYLCMVKFYGLNAVMFIENQAILNFTSN